MASSSSKELLRVVSVVTKDRSTTFREYGVRRPRSQRPQGGGGRGGSSGSGAIRGDDGHVLNTTFREFEVTGSK